MLKKVGLALLLLLVVIQFIQPTKNQSTEILASDITKVRQVPADVQEILTVACYDCHSNNTVYPWYSHIQPVAWWLNNHVVEGKQKLNFSTFGDYDTKKANHKLDETIEVLQKNEMPLKSYTLIHTNAKLTDAQKTLVINWVKSAMVGGETGNATPVSSEEKEREEH
ncbi:MAG TPA: heme-binding domain-containing protein [Chitinophagales bacterium]|nr:heme-binding domain-containing protein [Chitinophagales bacterium]